MAELSTAVASYLSLIAATADCLGQTYPHIGGPYRQRLLRLRSRLSYDVNRETLKDSIETVTAELKDYAGVVYRVQTQRNVEVKRCMLALRDVLETLAQCQESNGDRLGRLAAQVEQTPWTADPREHSEVAAGHAANLCSLAETMKHETASALTRMRDEMSGLDERLAGAGSTDPVTGLINCAELDRQVAAHRLHGVTFFILVFGLQGPLSDQVMRQAADRLSTQFRHRDRVARWSAKEFAVLFVGPSDLAKVRAAQAVARIAGRYTLENGEIVEITADVRMLPESAGV